MVVTFIGEVLTDSEDFSHLRKREIQLIHFFVTLFKAFQQMLDLELNSFVLLVCFRIFFHFLDLLDVLTDAFCKLQDGFSDLNTDAPYNNG